MKLNKRNGFLDCINFPHLLPSRMRLWLFVGLRHLVRCGADINIGTRGSELVTMKVGDSKQKKKQK